MALLSRSILTFTFLCPYDSSVDALCVGGGGFTICCSLAEFLLEIPSFYLRLFPGLPLAPSLDGSFLMVSDSFFPFNLVTRLGSCKSFLLAMLPSVNLRTYCFVLKILQVGSGS